MTALAVTYTFANLADILANEHNTNNSDIVNYINNRNDGSSTWDTVKATSSSAVPLVVNNSTGVVNIANFQDNGTNCLSIADGGATTITATGASTVALTVNNGTSTGNILNVQDNGSNVLTVADGGTVTITSNQLNLTDNGSFLISQTFASSALIIRTATSSYLEFQTNGATPRWRIESGGDFIPQGATGSWNIGNASQYILDLSYKTLTDRGCLPWADEGVELQDGRIVSDCEALSSIQKHPTKRTVHGLPMLDYKTFPKVSFKKAEVYGELLPRDKNDEPVGGQDGVEMTSMFGFMIGAIKELHARVKTLEGSHA